MTFYHHVEETLQASYRFHKKFHDEWIGWDGATDERDVDIYVRGNGVLAHFDPIGERLWRLDLYDDNRPTEGAGLRVIDVGTMFEATAAVIRAGKALGTLYLQKAKTRGCAQ